MSDISERTYRIVIGLLAGMVALCSIAWALILPPFTGPDELRHYNSVVRVIDGGGWPLPYQAMIEDSTLTAFFESGREYRGQGLEVLPLPEDRSALISDGTWERTAADQMVQHPPGYYLLVAGGVKLIGGEDLRWDHAQLAMRIMSALLVAGSIPLLAGIARRITGSRRAGFVGAAIALWIPFFTNAGGFVGNDTLLILCVSATLYCAVRALDSSRRLIPWLAGAGVALGAALMTKGFALMLIPVVAVLALVAAWRRYGALRGILVAGIPMAIAFVLGGWWWLRNLLVVGTLQPSMLGGRESQPEPAEGYDLGAFVSGAILRWNRTFWGRGAREDLALPEIAVDIAGVLLVATIIAGFVLARRRLLLLALWAYPFVILATTITNAHGIYWDTGDPSRGLQGRYVYSGLAALSATVGVVWIALSRRWRSVGLADAVAASFATAGLFVTAAAMMWVQRGGPGLAAMTAAHGSAPVAFVFVATLALAAGVGIFVAFRVGASDRVARMTRRRTKGTQGTP